MANLMLAFFRGSGPVLQRNPIFFVIFRGFGPPVPPSGSANVKHGHSLWIVIISKETAVIIQIKHLVCMLDAKATQNSILNKKKSFKGCYVCYID